MKEALQLNVYQTVRLKRLKDLPKGHNLPIYDGAECEVTHVYENKVMVRIGDTFCTVSHDCIDLEWLHDYRANIKAAVDGLRNKCAELARGAGNFTVGYSAADSIYKYLFDHPDYIQQLTPQTHNNAPNKIPSL